MTRIEHFAAKPDRMGRYLVRFSGGEELRLYRQTVEDFGLFAGLELTGEQMAALRESAGATSARMRAVRIVSASNVSRRDLEQRLVRKGESEVQARAAVEWMEQLHLIDDGESARQIVSHCAARGYGSARAKQMLYEKKIPKDLWETALAEFPDPMPGILAYLSSHLGEAPDACQIRRVTDALIRRGHSYGDIRRGLIQLEQDAELLQEEE